MVCFLVLFVTLRRIRIDGVVRVAPMAYEMKLENTKCLRLVMDKFYNLQ